MAFHPDKFPDNEIPSLQGQINNWLGDVLPTSESGANDLNPLTWASEGGGSSEEASTENSSGAAQTEYDLGESFQVYRFDASPFVQGNIPDRDLATLVQATDRWHHQLIANHKAIGYSRSMISGEGICQLFVSDLASAIQDAIVWLNRYEAEHPEYTTDLPRVRLLIVPGFNVYAFWIQRTRGFENETSADWESHVLVISAPDAMDKLPRQRLLDTKEFLSAFHGVTPMLGLTAPGTNGSSIIQL